MRYTITKTKEARVSPECFLAIEKFRQVERAKRKVEKLEEELAAWLSSMPTEDMEVYVEVTSEIEKAAE